ncbi:MAG: UDP-4-amino-4,6-dideoxy-N-acetyl-beta-L-altrosamine transaminase [Pseudomonadota bacterium]
MLPYARHEVDEEDIDAVVRALGAERLTSGPLVEAFERAVAAFTGAAHGAAVSSGTAALHAAYHALGLGPGDEVIVPAITFAATANAALYQGAIPVFADVCPDTLAIAPADAAAKITDRTRAIVAVDYAGQPADWDRLHAIAAGRGVDLIADSCHALGAAWRGRQVGGLAAATVFSFHPVKHVTTGEGGMVVTDDPDIAARVRRFRNHGIDLDAASRESRGVHAYSVVELGYNYRLADLNCALGLAQLGKLAKRLARRRALAALYDARLASLEEVNPLKRDERAEHAFHLYVVRLDARIDRDQVFAAMRARGIGVNVHYQPLHLHPLYRQRLGTRPGLCPEAERAYRSILSLPLFPAMTEADVELVVGTLGDSLAQARSGRVAAA